jgi:AmmeMemoRadiSam system protein B
MESKQIKAPTIDDIPDNHQCADSGDDARVANTHGNRRQSRLGYRQKNPGEHNRVYLLMIMKLTIVRKKKRVFVFSFAILILSGVLIMGTMHSSAGQSGGVRKPAVAGQFYPSDPSELKREVASFMAKGKKLDVPPVLLISPHAGYVFSGPVAGVGFAAVDKKVTTVILIGPSHHAYFPGVCISGADAFETPLGKIPLDHAIVEKLRKNPLVSVTPQADIPEHSIEVQLPFLQAALTSFSIVPVLTGKVEPSVVANMLLPYITPTTLVVASSDFSHYQSNKRARILDDQSIKTILSGNEDGPIDACGVVPIRVVMHLAEKLSLSPVLLDARTSYDTAPQYGDDSRVVGYASIVYVKKNATSRK